MAGLKYLGGTAVFVCLLLHGPMASIGSAEEAAGKTVKLKFATGASASRVFTPAKALTGGKPFRITGPQGPIAIGGKAVLFGARYSAVVKAYYGAMDVNGNGKLDGTEWVKLAQSMSATFQIRDGETISAVRVANVNIYAKDLGAPVTAISGGYVISGCQTGTVDGVMVRLFDDNMDGVFSQDGKDAIAVGRSEAAIPLMTIHQIGARHYRLAVAEDGSEMTVAPLEGVELGIVETPFRRGLACLALTSEDGKSYDLAASAKTGIPEGSYRLSYGVLAAGGQMTVVKPTEDCLTYEIQAGKINTLRIGSPMRVSFSASYSKGNISVSPSVYVYGAGGEQYSFDFSGGTGRPHVLLAQDSKLLRDVPMEYG